jgi:3-dehydroquinate dehydratase
MKLIASLIILIFLSCSPRVVHKDCDCRDWRVDMFLRLSEQYKDSLSLDYKIELIRGEMSLEKLRLIARSNPISF